MLIYCANAYGGDAQRKASAAERVRGLQRGDPDNTYISPIHAFGWLYKEMDYEAGIKMCLELLGRCDKLLIMSVPSRGVLIEMAFAEEKGIPIEYRSKNVEDRARNIIDNLKAGEGKHHNTHGSHRYWD